MRTTTTLLPEKALPEKVSVYRTDNSTYRPRVRGVGRGAEGFVAPWMQGRPEKMR